MCIIYRIEMINRLKIDIQKRNDWLFNERILFERILGTLEV